MFKIHKNAASYTINDVLADSELLNIAVLTVWLSFNVIWMLDLFIRSYTECPGFTIFLTVFFGLCAAGGVWKYYEDDARSR